MPGYLNIHNNYHEGHPNIGDILIPTKPNYWHTWNGSKWQYDKTKAQKIAQMKRNSLLSQCNKVINAYNRQKGTGKISEEQYKKCIEHRNQIVDIFKNLSGEFDPDQIKWPKF